MVGDGVADAGVPASCMAAVMLLHKELIVNWLRTPSQMAIKPSLPVKRNAAAAA